MESKASEIPFSKVKALGNKINIKKYQFIWGDADPIVEVKQCYVIGKKIHIVMHNNKTNEDMAFQSNINRITNTRLLEEEQIIVMYDGSEYVDMIRLNTEHNTGVLNLKETHSVRNVPEQFNFVIFKSTGLTVAIDDSDMSSANILETKEFGPVLFIPTDMGYGATGVLTTDKGELYNIGAYNDDGDKEINMINLRNKLSTYHGTKIDSCDEIEFLKKVK